MQVTSGTDWSTYGGNRRHYSLSLDDNDGAAILGDKWDALTWQQKRSNLQKLADTFVLQYLLGEGAIEKDFFEMRIKQIKERK